MNGNLNSFQILVLFLQGQQRDGSVSSIHSRVPSKCTLPSCLLVSLSRWAVTSETHSPLILSFPLQTTRFPELLPFFRLERECLLLGQSPPPACPVMFSLLTLRQIPHTHKPRNRACKRCLLLRGGGWRGGRRAPLRGTAATGPWCILCARSPAPQVPQRSAIRQHSLFPAAPQLQECRLT